MSKVRHITLPGGFKAAGVACGLKKSGRKDLSILTAEKDAAAAFVTTQNQVVGEPIRWCRKILPRGFGKIRGFVINSGCSNVCTGPRGFQDARRMAALTARALGTCPEKILVASTGLIGQRLPMAKISKGIVQACGILSTTRDAEMLHGIMTTDTRPKYAVIRDRIGSTPFTLAGIVKGSGMVAPSLATMIGVLTTDLAVTPAALHKALCGAMGETFGAITIDSDSSTSDIVAVLASGAAGNKPLTSRAAGFAKFATAVKKLCATLARAVVTDGEGATKCISITVRGARNDTEAQAAAKSVANSPLVKCAVHGGDPNVGRIVMALGKSPARIVPEKLSVKIGGVTVVTRGVMRSFDLKKVQRHLAGSEIDVQCDLHLGRGTFTALTCDLSRAYVAINADYST